MRNPGGGSFKILWPSAAIIQLFPFGPRAEAMIVQTPRPAPPCLRTLPVLAPPPLALIRRKNRVSPSPQLGCPPLPAAPTLHPRPATHRPAWATADPGHQ